MKPPQLRRKRAEWAGREGEARAAMFLRLQGWNIIDERRLHRMAAAVEAVAHEYVREGEDMRIDVILLAPASIPRHIVNAWMP